MVAIGRASAMCLAAGAILTASAPSPARAEDSGFLRFLFAQPQPVAARDPQWSYTVERTLEQPAKPAKPSTVTGSLPRAAAGALASTAATPHPRAGLPLRAQESITGPGHKLAGLASFYWQPQMTANGEIFDPRQMTAAHNTLPFNTKVRVTDVRTGRSVVVRINDRGPYKPGRIIDLSQAAAQSIGMASVGITPVKLEIVGR